MSANAKPLRRWEYATFVVQAPAGQATMTQFNELGADGWEFIQWATNASGERGVFMKREVTP